MTTKVARIVFFDFAMAMGGSVVVLVNTLKALDPIRYERVVVTALPADTAKEVFGGLGVRVIGIHYPANYVRHAAFTTKAVFNSARRRRFASYVYSLYALFVNAPRFIQLAFRIWRLKPSLIHTHNAINSMLISAMLRVPAVMHLHGPFGEKSGLELAAINVARKVICVSQGIADMLVCRGVDQGQLVVLSNPSPLPCCDASARDAYRARFAPYPGEVVVAHIGRLAPWKGQKEFVLAFARVAAQSSQAKGLIVGDDAEKLNQVYVKELDLLIRDLGLSGRLIRTGHVKDVHNLVAAVDVVVHSSTEPEPFGLVVTEAMALAKPVIAAHHGATAEIVEHERTGLIVDPCDSQALAAAILKLVIDPSLREGFGLAGMEKVKRDYSLEGYGSRLEAIYGGLDT
jgi:glycosyltransferase involved in cell wall biosynthesis